MVKLDDVIIAKISKIPFLCFFLDYDGTLTSIAETPEKAILSISMQKTLARLSKLKNVRVAIISGRSLADVKRKVGLKDGIIYVGNHGLEIEGENIQRSHDDASKFRKLIRQILEKIRAKLGNIPGVLLEDKGLGLSVHYRSVSADKYEELKNNFWDIVLTWTADNPFHVVAGKKVWEIRPKTSWNKGSISAWLLDHFASKGNYFPIVIGDDVTDEDVFEIFKDRGITIKVAGANEESSKAVYWLNSPDDVENFFKELIRIRETKALENV